LPALRLYLAMYPPVRCNSDAKPTHGTQKSLAKGNAKGNRMREVRSAVVTGANGMIGAATVRLLTEKGCAVLAIDLVAPSAKQDRVTPFAADVTQPEQIAAIAAEAGRLFGTADALVHIAGGAGPKRAPDLESTELSIWEHVMTLNVTSGFLLCQALLPSMRRQSFGRVAMLSSILARGEKGPPTTVAARLPYAAAKAALIGLTAQLAKDSAADGVTVNAVAPGLILGEPGTRIRDRFDALPDNERARMLGSIPAGRPGTADEVAGILAFLLSGAAGYINGATIAVDGAAS
jgi:NAD(P)-dependent dehydrogenase (short-subunit alcohol dehydrogenase family)